MVSDRVKHQIVTFALGEDAMESLILLRTPKYEFLLPDEERGVSVGIGDSGEPPENLLVSVEWGKNLVKIVLNSQRYTLDIQSVSRMDIDAALHVLSKMNFDNRFALKTV